MAAERASGSALVEVHMNRFVLLICLIVALMSFGCSDKPSSPTTAEPESPAATLTDLGWPDNLAGEELNPAFAEATWLPNDSLWKYDVIMVTIVWGNPVRTGTPTTNAPLIDWTGRLWINGVVNLDPRMLISFERGQDTLVVSDSFPPIRWVSYTKGDIDGITLAMFVDKSVLYVVEPELRFETVQDTISWTLSQLYRFDSLYHVNNTGIVAIHSMKALQPCLQGLMAGDWVKEDASHGTFAGVWGGPASNIQGRLHGKFWTTDDGKQVLEGEWISPQSNLTGVIKGRWHYYDPTMCPLCGEGHGYFGAVVTFPDRSVKPIRLAGEFGKFGATNDTLPFRGRWHVVCNSTAPAFGE